MKTNSFKRIAQSLGFVALVTLGSSSFALSTWNFQNGCGAVNNSFNNSSLSCAETTPNAGAVTMTAWSVTGTAGAKFAAASVGYYNPNGFGVTHSGENTGNPQHTVDNSGQTDLLMLNFGNYAVDLDSVRIGYKSDSSGSTTSTLADADISVFRFNGTSPTILTGETLTSLGSAGGWELVGNYADLSTTAAKAVNSTNKTSSWWIISAYNSGYGAASGSDQGAANSGGTTGLQNGNDYFKVLSVAGAATKLTQVPEPGSIALLGLGLVGLVASSRRSQKVA